MLEDQHARRMAALAEGVSGLAVADAAPETTRLYLSYEGNFLLSCTGKVVSCVRAPEGGALLLAFDQSCFHPQGGGQPSDVGSIQNERTGESLGVEKCTYDFGTKVVTHRCAFDGGEAPDFVVGDMCALSVSADERQRYSRCHTAGHMQGSKRVRNSQL